MRRVAWTAIFVAIPFAVCRSSIDELRVRCAFAIQNGLDFVAASQTETGGFVTECWHVDAPEQKTPVDAVFTASQILYSLSFCRDSASARGTEERAAKYLAAQRESPGVWHYYGSGTEIKISPDVDDTSVTWAALHRLEVPIPQAALDAVRASRDIDTVVNINALLLFGLAHENVYTVCKYVLAQIDNGNFQRGTVYYRSPLMFAHAFSRAYREGDVQCLQDGVAKIRDAVLSLQNPDGSWGNDLETAFAALTLLNLDYRGEALDRAIKAMLARQSADGAWGLAPAYRGAVQPLNYGARALTTAVSIEALTKYSTLQ